MNGSECGSYDQLKSILHLLGIWVSWRNGSRLMANTRPLFEVCWPLGKGGLGTLPAVCMLVSSPLSLPCLLPLPSPPCSSPIPLPTPLHSHPLPLQLMVQLLQEDHYPHDLEHTLLLLCASFLLVHHATSNQDARQLVKLVRVLRSWRQPCSVAYFCS